MVTEPEELILIGMNETENNELLVTHELADWNRGYTFLFTSFSKSKDLFRLTDIL